jgi:hypothetical protein
MTNKSDKLTRAHHSVTINVKYNNGQSCTKYEGAATSSSEQKSNCSERSSSPPCYTAAKAGP